MNWSESNGSERRESRMGRRFLGNIEEKNSIHLKSGCWVLQIRLSLNVHQRVVGHPPILLWLSSWHDFIAKSVIPLLGTYRARIDTISAWLLITKGRTFT